jgi:hypothetical protein
VTSHYTLVVSKFFNNSRAYIYIYIYIFLYLFIYLFTENTDVMVALQEFILEAAGSNHNYTIIHTG